MSARSTAWRVVAASVVGSAHTAAALPCQDAHGWQQLADGTLLVAVADGAGSAPRSAPGADMAVRAGLAALEAAWAPKAPTTAAECVALLRASMHAARSAVAALAENEGAPIREYATTLTLVVAGAAWLAVAQNGDGAVVVEAADGSLRTVARPDRGEYANEVAFLTAEDGLDHVTVTVEPFSASGLAVTTDGLLRLGLQLPAYEPHPPFFTPLLDFARSAGASDAGLAEFLASEPVIGRTDDDKTLVLAVPVAAAAGTPGDGADGPGAAAPAPGDRAD